MSGVAQRVRDRPILRLSIRFPGNIVQAHGEDVPGWLRYVSLPRERKTETLTETAAVTIMHTQAAPVNVRKKYKVMCRRSHSLFRGIAFLL